MRYIRVKVKRDTQTTSNSLVLPWEIPVLKYVFEDGNVEELDAQSNDAEYPDAGQEFARLMKVYGVDNKSGIPHAVSVYGEGARGVKAIREQIEEAQKADAKAKKPARASSRRQHAADPLMT